MKCATQVRLDVDQAETVSEEMLESILVVLVSLLDRSIYVEEDRRLMA